MKKIFALATWLTVSLLLVEPGQAQQLVFKACREGECLTWYLLKQTLLRQNPEPPGDRKLYEVEIDVDEQFYRYKSTPSPSPSKPRFQPPPYPPSRRPVRHQRLYKTVQWVNCSTQEPFIAEELEQQPDNLDVLYINPAGISTRAGSSHALHLYWAVCHNIWERQSQGIFLKGKPELAQNLGYPTTLTYRSQTISKKALLGTSDR